MKFIFAICFAGLSTLTFEAIQATPTRVSREKRSISFESCPGNLTPEECAAFARTKSKQSKFCRIFQLELNTIYWLGCATVNCGTSGRLVKENLRKPYPDCCAKCETAEEAAKKSKKHSFFSLYD